MYIAFVVCVTYIVVVIRTLTIVVYAKRVCILDPHGYTGSSRK
jgi:hypothetical protein